MADIKVGDKVRLISELTVTAVFDDDRVFVDGGSRRRGFWADIEDLELILPTTIEQFDAFPVGTMFRCENDRAGVNSRVKINRDHYVYVEDRGGNAAPDQMINVHGAYHSFNRHKSKRLIIVNPWEQK